MKSRHWWQALAAALLAAGVVFSLRGHAPDTSEARPSNRPPIADVPAAGLSAAVTDTASDPVPPPHEIPSAPPLGFAPAPDNDPLPSGGELDALLRPVEPATGKP